MDRRRFLQGTAALFAAPAIIKAEALMPVVPPQGIIRIRMPDRQYVIPDSDEFSERILRPAMEQYAKKIDQELIRELDKDLTPARITREALQVLHRELNFIGQVNTRYDDRFFTIEGVKRHGW